MKSTPTNFIRMRDKKWKSLQEDGPCSAQEIRRDGDTIFFKKVYPTGSERYGSIDGWGRVVWLENND